MKEHIKAQIIKQNGKPVFAVIPWDEYQKLVSNKKPEQDNIYFPHEVIKYNAIGDTLIKAWRKYFGLTQNRLAELAGMKQSALARIESGKHRPKNTTLKKLAKAMDIDTAQLIE